MASIGSGGQPLGPGYWQQPALQLLQPAWARLSQQAALAGSEQVDRPQRDPTLRDPTYTDPPTADLPTADRPYAELPTTDVIRMDPCLLTWQAPADERGPQEEGAQLGAQPWADPQQRPAAEARPWDHHQPQPPPWAAAMEAEEASQGAWWIQHASRALR